MKAVVCPQYGPPEVLQIREIEKPVPGGNEVLIKVIASTVASGDCRARRFDVPKGYWLPARLSLGITKPRKAILGTELAGEIEAVGASVTRFKKGDPVFAAVAFGQGAHAEYSCLQENGPVARKPKNFTFEEAAAMPFGGLTVLYFLRDKANIRSGQSVLIYGASGAVGTYAVQLAKYYGTDVTAVCSTANLALVQSLGADKVIDYTREDFTQNSSTYDVIFDAVGKLEFAGCSRALKDNGLFLNVEMALTNIFRMLWTSLRGGRKLLTGVGKERAEDLAFLRKLAEEGKLKPVIDRRYSMEQIVEAHRYVETGHKKGNVVVNISPN